MENTVIKIGVYTSGAHLRMIGEMDLINQDQGHKEMAIYLLETTVMRDPREEITDDYIKNFAMTIRQSFKDGKTNFKTVSREDADKFIAFNMKTWDVVRELAPFDFN
jgi:hypothetical protein